MKRPWILTPRGQRLSMLLATLLSIIALPIGINQIQSEASSSPAALDTRSVDYCEVSTCGKIAKLAGLEVLEIESVDVGPYGILIEVRLLNHGLLEGDREVWAELRSATGGRIESMRGVVNLSPKGRQVLELFFTGSIEELESGKLLLGF